MGLSSIAVQQREKEDEGLKSFIVFSLIGSVGLHVAVLSLSNFWVRETKLAEEPIEVIVVDTPSIEAAKPEPTIPPKIGGGSKPSASTKPSNPAPEAKSSQTASRQEIALSPPAKVEKPSSLKATNIEKPLAIPQPTPTATPKVAEALPPVPTPQPQVVAMPIPTPVSSLPSDLIAKLKSTPIPTPTPTPTPLASEKPTPIPSLIAVATPKLTPTPVTTPPQVSSPKPIRRSPSVTAASPSPRNNQPPYTPSSEKLSNIAKSSNSSVSQSNAATSNKVGDRSLTPGLQNPAGNNSGSSAPTRNQSGNNSSGQGDNNSGSSEQRNNNSGGKEKVATAPSNTTKLGEGLLSPRPGSGSLACRRCPDPAYPKRAERRGLQGTVKLVFDADRNGNISNIRVGNSSGHDILDRAAIDVVKDWKLASSDSEQQGISQSFTFAKKGSDTESLARERREKQERARLVREKEQQEKERLARQQQQEKEQQEKERLARQQQEQERQAREQQQQEQELRDRAPVTTPEPLVTPSTPIEPLPTTTPSSPIEPSPVPFESLTPSLPPE